MKAIVNTSAGRLEMQELPTPKPRAGEVLISTGACGICATDLAMIAGWPRTGFPSIPGHEWSGTVEAAGRGVDASLVGRRCVAENVLKDGGEVGFEHPGGYGEFLITEAANLQLLPNDFPFATAALIEPLAVAARGMRRLRLDDKSSALIFGDGPIGLIAVMLLRRAGVGEIVLVGGRGDRLRLAGELGARTTLNYHEIRGTILDAVKGVSRATFPSVIEASGSARAMEAAVELAGQCGKVLVIGDYADARAGFRWNHLLWREIEIIGSNASAQAWPEAARLALEGAVPLGRLVSHTFPASRFAEAVELVRSRKPGVIKVVLEWR